MRVRVKVLNVREHSLCTNSSPETLCVMALVRQTKHAPSTTTSSDPLGVCDTSSSSSSPQHLLDSVHRLLHLFTHVLHAIHTQLATGSGSSGGVDGGGMFRV